VTSRLLNAWVHVSSQDSSILGGASIVSLETTSPISKLVLGEPSTDKGDTLLPITLMDTGLVMAEDQIMVADGLIRTISVQKGIRTSDNVALYVRLEHPSKPTIVEHQGVPFRTDIVFPRTSLAEILKDKEIVIDPGHGGKDKGFKGPVNLLEKDITLEVATHLASLLSGLGATPLLTRETDISVPQEKRIGLSLGADLCIVIHTSGSSNPLERSYNVFAKPECQESFSLAEYLMEALDERMGLKFVGVMEHRGLSNWLVPTARVESLCLTHFADEANFRAPLFRKRTAQAIFNGVLRYLASRKPLLRFK
jgi:N-acetylmuramoyl-L-alanine amidase